MDIVSYKTAVQGYREIADELEALLELSPEIIEYVDIHPLTIVNFWNKEALVTARTTLGGTWEKRYTNWDLELSMSTASKGKIYLQVPRSKACVQVEVGEEEVEIVDPNVVLPKVKVIQKKYEWRCDPILDVE